MNEILSQELTEALRASRKTLSKNPHLFGLFLESVIQGSAKSDPKFAHALYNFLTGDEQPWQERHYRVNVNDNLMFLSNKETTCKWLATTLGEVLSKVSLDKISIDIPAGLIGGDLWQIHARKEFSAAIPLSNHYVGIMELAFRDKTLPSMAEGKEVTTGLFPSILPGGLVARELVDVPPASINDTVRDLFTLRKLEYLSITEALSLLGYFINRDGFIGLPVDLKFVAVALDSDDPKHKFLVIIGNEPVDNKRSHVFVTSSEGIMKLAESNRLGIPLEDLVDLSSQYAIIGKWF